MTDRTKGTDMDKLEQLREAAKKVRDGFTYNPGHSDLDDEQPIHIRVTLGEWRALNYALALTFTNE